MSQQLRRFEILLPLRFSDGSTVPADLLEDTRSEFRREFGGTLSGGRVVTGFEWIACGEETMGRLCVDVQDTAENLAIFLAAKDRLQRRFREEEISITTYNVEKL